MTTQHLTNFTTLLASSTKLLHNHKIDIKSLALEATAASPDQKPKVVEEESDDESEDDDDLFGMLGGYESSENEVEEGSAQVEGEWEDDAEEDEATLLKRASAVHSALLLSVDRTDEKGLDLPALMSDNELSEVLSYVLSPSTFDSRPKSFRGSHERWNKVCSTNVLLAIQYLLHLMHSSSSVLAGWNSVILPLLFGNEEGGACVSVLVKNDVLREEVLNLTTVSSFDNIADEISNTCNVCLGAIREASSSLDVMARQKKINVVCSVLIHLFDNIPKLSKGTAAILAELQNVVSDALHSAVLVILRGICYETLACNGDDVKVQPPLLSVEALRIITGMLLLKLYPPGSEDPKLKNGGGACKAGNTRAVELWSELLMLLSPYSADVIEDSDGQGKRRRCKNWNYAAPLSATAILCVILPTFVHMELPTIARVKNDINDNLKWEVNKEVCSRPAMQSSLWDLLRACLGRCDHSPNFTGRSGDGGDGGGRGTSLLSQKKSSFATDAEDGARPMDDAPTDQLLRRRAAHCLRLLVEYERETLKRKTCGKKGKQQSAKGKVENAASRSNIECTEAWMKYVLVFEMLEMEIELHLVDQVWPTMKELASRVVDLSQTGTDGSQHEVLNQFPQLIWKDIASILSRVLLSDAPTLRKLGLYRFLRGDSGVDVNIPASSADRGDEVGENTDSNVFMNKPKSKHKIKKDTGGDAATLKPAPLASVSVAFVLDVVLVSYDSIIGTKVGTNMQIDEDGMLKSESITPLLSGFLSNYTITLSMVDGANTHRLGEYINQFFGPNLAKGTKPRSLVTFFNALATALESISAASLPTAILEPTTVRETIRTMLAEFSSGGAPRTLQDALKRDLALALQHTTPWQNPDISVVLQVLALYPPEDSAAAVAKSKDVSLQKIARVALTAWLKQLGNGNWATTATSACCSAYVMGDLIPFSDFDWIAGVNIPEREAGAALCTLAALLGNARETLWPAVFKGLQNVPSVDSKLTSFCKANRSMILLEFGCRESVLSGVGNGNLVIDKNKQMLLPPPQIEGILNNAVSFVLSQLTHVSRTLVATKDGKASGANRSSEANNVSSHLAMLITQVTVLHHSFPSSVSIPLVVNNTLKNTVDSMASGPANVVESQILLYAALSCGAEFGGSDSLAQITKTCETILDLDFSAVINGLNARKDTKQALRSIFQYAKWGCLSLLIPMLVGKDGADSASTAALSQKIIQAAQDSVDATPVIALQPLFQSVVAAAQNIIVLHSTSPSEGSPKDPIFLNSMQTTTSTLFAILDEENTSSNYMYMLHQICKLIFQPKLLREEYETAYLQGKSTMPVLAAFEKLLTMGGTTKSHIYKVAVSFISTAWLGEEGSDDVGVLAIPYRKHIVDLLLYKEGKFDESAAHQASYQQTGILPDGTDVSSITRGFVLVFLSKLPPFDSISKTVLTELVEFVIDGLLGIGCAGPAVGKPFISGSDEYARAIRSWQAVCLLNNFITDAKAQAIAPKVFKAMSNNTHGQVRFFMEVFCIQCIRKHPDVFGGHFISEINRADLPLQYVASLMVLGGNVIVGKYSSTFFQSSSEQRIKDVLCGAIPWLSSTQGFSRAIAQLLVHRLIPLVVKVSPNVEHGDKCKDSAVFVSIYSFLETNGEMARLRTKQQNFFDSYDVDDACSLDGLLSIPVDEGEEANPLHLVDAIKECLAEVYTELHEEDAPLWKQMEDLAMNEKQAHTTHAVENNTSFHDDVELVNFQRKILPIDALDLSIQSLRDQKLFNSAGKRKQDLIICATLVDKVPNLAGLARTAEIFSAKMLVIPNLLVKKQDDFKTISASANDWIEMEECKEEELLNWLYKKKSQGYTIVGLEQTSSSKCITKFRFPGKTVLLLGKEKEGIPVEFLSAVDQCIEIPQLGIIRSLNVHVTGAIAIWKFTEQMMRKNK